MSVELIISSIAEINSSVSETANLSVPLLSLVNMFFSFNEYLLVLAAVQVAVLLVLAAGVRCCISLRDGANPCRPLSEEPTIRRLRKSSELRQVPELGLAKTTLDRSACSRAEQCKSSHHPKKQASD